MTLATVLAQIGVWLATLVFGAAAAFLMIAPFVVSVIANVGRRPGPVIHRTAKAQMTRAAPRRSAAA